LPAHQASGRPHLNGDCRRAARKDVDIQINEKDLRVDTFC
jgi:hypothetical protein